MYLFNSNVCNDCLPVYFSKRLQQTIVLYVCDLEKSTDRMISKIFEI
jgi:hypothetical protein